MHCGRQQQQKRIDGVLGNNCTEAYDASQASLWGSLVLNLNLEMQVPSVCRIPFTTQFIASD